MRVSGVELGLAGAKVSPAIKGEYDVAFITQALNETILI